MGYSNVFEFRDDIIAYLNEEKSLCLADIEARQSLDDDEKEKEGMLIRHARVLDYKGKEYQFGFEINLTKVRPGDKVQLVDCVTTEHLDALVIDNQTTSMFVVASKEINIIHDFCIEVTDMLMLDPLIKLIGSYERGCTGLFYLKELAGLAQPETSDPENALDNRYLPNIDNLNVGQKDICKIAFGCPSLFIVQGPPGTGKTNVLSVITDAYAMQDRNVVVLAKTHQAVNNALNKIKGRLIKSSIYKIGSRLKSLDLDPSIKISVSFSDCLRSIRIDRKKGCKSSVIGMTLQSAIINLGLRLTEFTPDIVLVDEASQIPLTEACAIGAFGSGSVIFIGDDKQMPPIFHEKQVNDPLSVSVFNHLKAMFPDIEGRLSETYRMNADITSYVSSHFYDPFGEKLISSDFSKNRKLCLVGKNKDKLIENILSSEKSIFALNVSKSSEWEDDNFEEAQFAANVAKYALSLGLPSNDIAIISPFRRQVLAIQTSLKSIYSDAMPLIDTVERLQGQDVEMIIISFATTSEAYYEKNKHFLLDKHRLNVMVSRAKTKVLILKSDIIEIDI